MSATLLVIGSTNTDMVVRVPQLPRPGETVLGGTFEQHPGGKGANQAVAAARAGATVRFLTALGDDACGEESLTRFQHEGIETCWVRSVPATPTGVALILVDAAGENLIAVAPGANSVLTPADIRAAASAFADVPWVVVSMELPMETVEAAVAQANTTGCRVLLNPAPMPASGLPVSLLRQVDVLTPNAGELAALVPTARSQDEAAQSVLAAGPKALVVTLGRQGAQLYTPEMQTRIPALPVTAVDTVGAGDCFSATLAVALAEGQPLDAAVAFATVAAGIATMTPGAQTGMPFRHTIDHWRAHQ